jgi:RNA polymerase sigma-70 factor (ECF subfamily)
MDSLVRVLHEDAIQTMPPFAMWIHGADDICQFMLGPGHACRGSRLIPIAANGSPAFAHYKPDPQRGDLTPWAIMVLDTSGDRVTGIHSFLEIVDTEHLFPAFGLAPRLPAGTPPTAP